MSSLTSIKESERVKPHLENLHLLVLAHRELGALRPVRRVLPPVLDQAGRVTVDLHPHNNPSGPMAQMGEKGDDGM